MSNGSNVDYRKKLRAIIINESYVNLSKMVEDEVITGSEFNLIRGLLLELNDVVLIIHEAIKFESFNTSPNVMFKVKVYSDTKLHRDGSYIKLLTGKNKFTVSHTKSSIESLSKAIDFAMNCEAQVELSLPRNEEELNVYRHGLFSG